MMLVITDIDENDGSDDSREERDEDDLQIDNGDDEESDSGGSSDFDDDNDDGNDDCGDGGGGQHHHPLHASPRRITKFVGAPKSPPKLSLDGSSADSRQDNNHRLRTGHSRRRVMRYDKA